MTKDEFKKLLHEEQENGMEVAGLSISRDDLKRMSLYTRKAGQIIERVGRGAIEDGDLDLVTDCMMAGEGISLVTEKLLMPMMDQIQRDEGKAEE